MTDKRIIICLSGGGFRASLFHMGMLRRLHELDVLDDVHAISSVSGGSIFSAFLADHLIRHPGKTLGGIADWEREISVPFRAFTSRDLRTVPVVANCLWNVVLPGPRARAMLRRYRARLTSEPLAAVPDAPKFVFCATDTVFGVNWIFTKETVGDYQVGYADTPPDMPLALAVAASACFPPIFGPISLSIPPEDFKRNGKYKGKDRDDLIRRLCLSDGGVYDNLGLEPALRGYDVAVVSDAGAPFGFEASKMPIHRNARYLGVIMNQVASLRKRQLFECINEERRQCDLSEQYGDCKMRVLEQPCAHANLEGCKDHSDRRTLRQGLYMALSSDVEGYVPSDGEPAEWAGYSKPLVKDTIAAIRTDLDRFTAAEQKILENHGYMLAEAGMKRYVGWLRGAKAKPFSIPHPEWMDEDAVKKALGRSGNRVLHTRWFGCG